MADDEAPTFTIRGVEVQVTAADVLAATFRAEPPPVAPGTWWVLVRRKRVPARWAYARTLAYLAAHGRTVPREHNSGALQTRPALRTLSALGFPIGQAQTAPTAH